MHNISFQIIKVAVGKTPYQAIRSEIRIQKTNPIIVACKLVGDTLRKASSVIISPYRSCFHLGLLFVCIASCIIKLSFTSGERLHMWLKIKKIC